jgi:hypothetical protein
MLKLEVTPRLLLIAPLVISGGLALSLLVVYLILVPTVLTVRHYNDTKYPQVILYLRIAAEDISL